MNKSYLAPDSNSFFQRYKELIVTTIICLFLTGIYDSINTQTAEIKKWYQLMIGINERVKVQATQLGNLQREVELQAEHADQRFKEQRDRIRSVELQVVPFRGNLYNLQQPNEDTTHVNRH